MFEQLDDPRPPTFDGAFRRRVVRRAHQRRRRRLAGGAGAVAAAVTAGAVGLYAPSAWRARDIERVEVAGTGDVAAGEPVTVLVTGVDAPHPDADAGVVGVRADTIMAVRFDPTAGRLSVLSLPRDLMVADAAGNPARINDIGDPAALVDVVETQVGVPIDHMLQIDIDGFRSLVDRLDGIAVWVPAPVRDRSSGLYVDTLGCVRLDGEQALALARSRRLEVLQPDGTWADDPYADISRVARQRVVVASALAGLDRVGRSPSEVRDQVEWAVDHVTLDADLSLDDLVELGTGLAALAPEDIIGATIPVMAHPDDPNRLALAPEAAAVAAAFATGDPLLVGPPDDGAEAPPPPPTVASEAPSVAVC